jgi:hypothetical protein
MARLKAAVLFFVSRQKWNCEKDGSFQTNITGREEIGIKTFACIHLRS